MPKCMKCMQDFDQQKYCPFCGAKAQQKAADQGQIPTETILSRRFIIGEVLDRDKIGFTYVVWDALLERKVVIKEWFPEKLAQRDSDKRMVRFSINTQQWDFMKKEFLENAKKLHKRQEVPVLIPIYTFFEENNTAYYVMEDTEGFPLRRVLEQKNPLSPAEAGELMNKVNSGLEILHKNGIIHGNLSPDNIWLCPDGTVRFLNAAWFGKSQEEAEYKIFRGRYASPVYAHPPVKPDVKLDTYSAAAVYYRMLSGEEPRRLKSGTFLPLKDYGVEVPAKVEKQIMDTLGSSAQKGGGLLRFLQGLNVVLVAAVIVLGILIIL